MNSIGETLRHERQRLNLDLQQVAAQTKISVKLLEAIEADDFEKLPGGVFTKSFVRQYARLLGLDEDEILSELQRSTEPPPAEPTAGARPPEPPIEIPRVADWAELRPRSSSSLPALALVVVVMLVCSAIYAWWQRSRRPGYVVPEPPAVVSPASPAPQAVAPAAAPPIQHTAAGEPAASVPPAADRESPADPAAAAAAGENAGSPVHVYLTATETTWISARADGKMIYSGTLQPEEKKDFGATRDLRLVVGNAGGLSITANGQPVPPLGPSGQVRVVQFSPGGVQIVPRNPPPAADPL